jgi:hypothetical protein
MSLGVCHPLPALFISDAPPSSLCDPKRVQRVGFAKMVRNLVPFPASSTKRGRGVMLEAPGLNWEEIKLFVTNLHPKPTGVD